jgi:hypothetical protein
MCTCDILLANIYVKNIDHKGNNTEFDKLRDEIVPSEGTNARGTGGSIPTIHRELLEVAVDSGRCSSSSPSNVHQKEEEVDDPISITTRKKTSTNNEQSRRRSPKT